ncbi:DUF6428 family protein [Flavobacterium restrictum]|uniref:Uncharacterized protein n=1 Tax=Flavobacterium restrictum TaxID=2594428 RepID=A0A553E223_9FLAO|nr:DUF6428 family protein [Flavobacterium restrictum]TRX39030.1 hypothetical protein FNW21_10590 [Flavobacterium restrictum]
MKLSQIKSILKTVATVQFTLPNGSAVPEHFHVTEVGLITKKFIDCGGTLREEVVVNFQLWDANDWEHRLKPQKLLDIIELSEKVIGIGDHEIEVEYQDTTIGKYDLDFDGNTFLLVNKKTACLALNQCGIPAQKPNVILSEIKNQSNSCTPGGGCC